MSGLGSPARPVRGAQRGSIWTGLVVVIALIAALCVLLVLVAGSRQGTVRRGWKQTLGTPEDVFAAHPAREANAVALEVERLAAELEIDAVPWHRRSTRPADRRRPQPGHPRRVRKQELGAWVSDAIGSSRLEIGEPPQAVVTYLDDRAEVLEAIRDLLDGGESPAWERRLEALMQAPVPNLLGLLDLQQVIVADALLQIRRGDEVTALRDLEAAWRLAGALIGEPEQIVGLVGITMSRRVAGALRHVDSAPLEWSSRLVDHEVRRPVMRSMLLTAWVWSQTDGGDTDSALDGFLPRMIRELVAPYAKMSMADLSERLRVRLERLQEADPRCDADLDALGVGFELKIPRWSVARSIYGPGMFEGVIDRANRLELDMELTARLIEIRAARRANGGRWPTASPGSAVSRACPADRWSYEIEPDGALRFGLDRAPEWRNLPPSNRGVLPTTVVVR